MWATGRLYWSDQIGTIVGNYYCVPRQLPTPNSQLPTPKFQFATSNAQLPGVGIAAAIAMGASDWTPKKPFDLRERLLEFACLIVRVVQFLHTRGPVAAALSYQLLKCGPSAGANYEEADDGSSPRDTAAKRMITLRELKEAKFRLRVLRRCDMLTRIRIRSSMNRTS